MFYKKDFEFPNHIIEDDTKVIFLPKENEKSINVDIALNINKIILYKHLGIFYYCNDVLINYKKFENALISYDEKFNCFIIDYETENKKYRFEDLDRDFSFNRIYIRYGSVEEAYDIEREEKIIKEFNVGDLVMPNGFLNPSKQELKYSFAGLISLKILSSLSKGTSTEEKLKSEIENLFRFYNYKIIEKTDIFIEDERLYLIESNVPQQLFDDELYDKDKFIEKAYIPASELNTLDMLYKNIDLYKNFK